MVTFSNTDLFAFLWFVTSWFIYIYYAKYAAKKRSCLASILYRYRIIWVQNMLLQKEPRITDMAVLEHLGRTVNFFASSTIFMIAGSITLLASSEKINALLSTYDFISPTNTSEIQLKLCLLGLIFIYAFFKFTWAMRQYSFCAVLLGAAPYGERSTLSKKEKLFAKQLAKISDQGSHNFNYGLRAYYFALGLLSWFVSPLLFIPITSLIVCILYFREFHSKTLKLLVKSQHLNG